MKSVQVIQPVTQPPKTLNGMIASPSPLSLAEASPTYQPKLIISTYGKEGSGKSRLGGSMPGPIGALFFEHKSKTSVMKAAREFGRKVIVPVDETGQEMSFIRVDNPMLLSLMPDVCISPSSAELEAYARNPRDNPWPGVQERLQEIAQTIRVDGQKPTCCKRHYYRYNVNRAKWALWKMADDSGIQTLIVDTFGQLVQDISYANYGKDGVIDPKEFGFAPRQDMNQEIRDLMNSLSHKHMFLTHQSAGVWKDNKPVPGKTKASSQFSGLGHYCTVQIEQWRNDSAPIGGGRYGFMVKDCQANAALIGRDDLLWDENITAQMLAINIFGDDDEFDPEEYD